MSRDHLFLAIRGLSLFALLLLLSVAGCEESPTDTNGVKVCLPSGPEPAESSWQLFIVGGEGLHPVQSGTELNWNLSTGLLTIPELPAVFQMNLPPTTLPGLVCVSVIKDAAIKVESVDPDVTWVIKPGGGVPYTDWIHLGDSAASGTLKNLIMVPDDDLESPFGAAFVLEFSAVTGCDPTASTPNEERYALDGTASSPSGDLPLLEGSTTRWDRNIGVIALGEDGDSTGRIWGATFWVDEPVRETDSGCVISVKSAQITISDDAAGSNLRTYVFPTEAEEPILNDYWELVYISDTWIEIRVRDKFPMQRQYFDPITGFSWGDTRDFVGTITAREL